MFPPADHRRDHPQTENFNDQNLRETIKDNEKEIMKLVNTYLHCG